MTRAGASPAVLVSGAMPKSRTRKRPQPPPKAKPKRSAEWVGALFFTLLGAGIIVIVANYLGAFPGGTSTFRLFAGLGLIAGSFVVATRWH